MTPATCMHGCACMGAHAWVLSVAASVIQDAVFISIPVLPAC